MDEKPAVPRGVRGGRSRSADDYDRGLSGRCDESFSIQAALTPARATAPWGIIQRRNKAGNDIHNSLDFPLFLLFTTRPVPSTWP